MQQFNLYCIHFAGGSKYSYGDLSSVMPNWINVHYLELPGRGVRIKEQLLCNLSSMADDLFRKIKSTNKESKYAIYGHSMGALITYLIACRATDTNWLKPVSLILTGFIGPSVKPNKVSLYTDDILVAKLKDWGATPPFVFNSPELMALYLPIIRADLIALENFCYKERAPLDIPLHVGQGNDDDMSDRDIDAWQKESRHELDLQKFSGGHFFINDRPKLGQFISKSIYNDLSFSHDEADLCGSKQD